MRSTLLRLPLLMFFLAQSASAVVTIDWVTIGGGGNGCMPTQFGGCVGTVAEPYRISEFETTNAQYVEFLNAVAATDTNALYNTNMGSGGQLSARGGITRSGSSGTFSYSVIVGRENLPVNWVSFWDAARFANWLHNGQPAGAQDNTTTEDGAYSLTLAMNSSETTRNAEAKVFVTNQDEWYKAAYYDIDSMIYFEYPAGSDTATTCTSPGAVANTANCFGAVGDMTDVGSYTAAASPNGTFDQAGNVREWIEGLEGSGITGFRGGTFFNDSFDNNEFTELIGSPATELNLAGFRVASLAPPPPVPSMTVYALIILSTLLGLAGWWGLSQRQLIF